MTCLALHHVDTAWYHDRSVCGGGSHPRGEGAGRSVVRQAQVEVVGQAQSAGAGQEVQEAQEARRSVLGQASRCRRRSTWSGSPSFITSRKPCRSALGPGAMTGRASTRMKARRMVLVPHVVLLGLLAVTELVQPDATTPPLARRGSDCAC